MASVSKNVCLHHLVDITNRYNNTCYSKIKMKLLDAKSST